MTKHTPWVLALISGVGIGWYLHQASDTATKKTPLLPRLVSLIESDLDSVPGALKQQLIRELAILYLSWEKTDKTQIRQLLRDIIEDSGLPRFLAAAQVEAFLTKLTQRLEPRTP